MVTFSFPNQGSPNPTISGPPITWTLQNLKRDTTYCCTVLTNKEEMEAWSTPIPAPVLLSSSVAPEGGGATQMTFTTTSNTTASINVTAHAVGWARVAVNEGSSLRPSIAAFQWVWVGEMLMYDPSGKLWTSDAQAWIPRPDFPSPLPASDLNTGQNPTWGIAWVPAPGMPDIDSRHCRHIVTCYILNLHALDTARQESTQLQSCTFPIGTPDVWTPPKG
jgi:hypothetical protein